MGLLGGTPIAENETIKIDKNLMVRYLSKYEETRRRKALDNREMRMRSQRENANEWRRP